MVFGEDLKGALLDAIVTAQIGTTFCKGMCPLSKCPTILDDLFVPGRYVRSKKSARVLLRMMQMHNQNWWSAHKLQESMCLYASSLGQEGSELSPRKTMVDWANRMLEMLWRLSLVDHISSPAVKISIAKAMAFGRPRSEEYCFGNPYIKSQLAVFVERLLAKKIQAGVQYFSLFHHVAIYLFLKSPPKPLFSCILLDLLFPGRESAAFRQPAAFCSSSTNWAAVEEAQILHP